MTAPSWPLSYQLLGDNPALAAEFGDLLYSCGFQPTTGDKAVITIVVNPAGQQRAGLQAPGETVVEWRGLVVREHIEFVSFTYQSWYLELHLSKRTLWCRGPAPDSAERLTFREFFLLSPLLFVMHRIGYFEIHAAACVNHDVGYLFVGSAGSGKTSAIVSLIQSGSDWRYISDDSIVLHKTSDETISVRPLRRSFSLRPDLIEQYPVLAPHARVLVPGTDKKRLDPMEVWPDKYVGVASPRFLISCKVSNQEESSIVPISRATALARLVASTPWIMLDRSTASAHLDAFRALAERSFSFELRAGRELLRDRTRLACLLDTHELTQLWTSADAGPRNR